MQLFLPMMTCTIPSCRRGIPPYRLDILDTLATSLVTVPDLGLGIILWDPARPILPTTPIMSGVYADVELEPVLVLIFSTHSSPPVIGAGFLWFPGAVALGKHQHARRLAGTVGELTPRPAGRRGAGQRKRTDTSMVSSWPWMYHRDLQRIRRIQHQLVIRLYTFEILLASFHILPPCGRAIYSYLPRRFASRQLRRPCCGLYRQSCSSLLPGLRR